MLHITDRNILWELIHVSEVMDRAYIYKHTHINDRTKH